MPTPVEIICNVFDEGAAHSSILISLMWVLDSRQLRVGVYSVTNHQPKKGFQRTSDVQDPELDGWKNDSVEAIIFARESRAFEPAK